MPTAPGSNRPLERSRARERNVRASSGVDSGVKQESGFFERKNEDPF
jgi:hypothetical protein